MQPGVSATTSALVRTQNCKVPWQVQDTEPSHIPTMSKTDKIVLAKRKRVAKAQRDVLSFLTENGFDTANPNKMRGSWWVTQTFPIHEAVKQNKPDIVALLLHLGANPSKKDTWGRTAYYLARKLSHKTVMDILTEYQEHQSALESALEAARTPMSSSSLALSKLHSYPPPRGFEEFFAKVSQDPLVQVPNCEADWLKILGPKICRGDLVIEL